MSVSSTDRHTFLFVHGPGPAVHRKEIRSHLSREGYRKRKALEAHKQRSRVAAVHSPKAVNSAWYCSEGSMAVLDRRLLAAHYRKHERQDWTPNSPHLAPLAGCGDSEACSKQLHHQCAANSLVSAIERDLIHLDPFATLPVSFNRSAEALAYLTIRLFLEATPSWTSSKFTEAISLPLAFLHKPIFCAMLAVTSGYIDAVLGRGPSVETTIWAGASVSYVNQLISSPDSRYGDDALVAILSLLSSEVLLGNGENCRVHSRGLARLLMHRGGFWSLQGSHSIDMYASFLLITPIGKSRIAYLDHIQSDADGFAEIKDWMLDLDFSMSTLMDLNQWSMPRFAKQADICDGLKDLMQILTTTEDELDESQQFFILHYLALTRWDYRMDSESYFILLRKLCQKLMLPGPLSEVTWTLIQGLDEDRQRKWKVLRMTKVAHRLGKNTAARLKQFLYLLIRSSFDDMKVASLTGRELVQIHDEALAGLPVHVIET